MKRGVGCWVLGIGLAIAGILFADTAYGRTAVEGIAQVEKLFMEGKYDRVVSEAGKLIDAGAHNREELFYLKGLSQLKLSMFKEGRETFRYMIERYPKGKRAFDGYIGIGDSYYLEGRAAESITTYREALADFPDHKNAALVYYRLADAYQAAGNTGKAKEYFDEAKKASPLSFEAKTPPEMRLPASPATPSFITKEPGQAQPAGAGSFYVQAGYFKVRDNAQKLAERLHHKGYESYISMETEGAQSFYRVKVGHFATRQEAEDMSRRLRFDGFKNKVCM